MVKCEWSREGDSTLDNKLIQVLDDDDVMG